MVRYTFHKEERLCSRKLIGTMFESGQSFLSYPLKVVYYTPEALDGDTPVQVGFTVPKKNFKRAVKRNLLKRRIREAYRLQKHELHEYLSTTGQQVGIMFIYVGKEPLGYRKIEGSVKKAINRLEKELTNRTNTEKKA
jgi:ribonuclease P protein component